MNEFFTAGHSVEVLRLNKQAKIAPLLQRCMNDRHISYEITHCGINGKYYHASLNFMFHGATISTYINVLCILPCIVKIGSAAMFRKANVILTISKALMVCNITGKLYQSSNNRNDLYCVIFVYINTIQFQTYFYT